MKKVLIPTDFSATAENAIGHTIDFFKDSAIPIKIYLLNVYMVPNVEKDQILTTNDQLKLDSQLGLKKTYEKVNELLQGAPHQLECISILGSLKNVIPSFITKNNIDLVIMGKDGGKHVEEISSVLKKKRSSAPLMIVY
jgi:nucleotide-binding universal stress UspA family protein